MKFLGRALFIILLPLVRLFIRHTSRAYVIIESRNQVLMAKGWFGRQLWQLPGGGASRKETNLQAAVRELKEETGLVIDPALCQPVISGRWQTDRLGHSYEIFYCRMAEPLPVKTRRPELIDCRWIHTYELSQDNCAQDVLRALGAAGLI